jgi:hypothetical protein
MNENKKLFGTFHDAETGETIKRELTQEEIDALSIDVEILEP